MKRKLNKFILTTLLVLGGGLFSISGARNSKTSVQASTHETKRIWLDVRDVSWWVSADAYNGLHSWGGGDESSWPGDQMVKDNNNNLYYVDVPVHRTTAIFTRANKTDHNTVWNRTYNQPIDSNYNNRKMVIHDGKGWEDNIEKNYSTWESFTPVITEKVNTFHIGINTQEAVCSSQLAEDAINRFNNLSTFEQNQYKTLNVGGGITGLERLEYLKDYYNITTPIGASSVSQVAFDNTDNNTGIVIIGGLSALSIGMYFLLNKKKVFG